LTGRGERGINVGMMDGEGKQLETFKREELGDVSQTTTQSLSEMDLYLFSKGVHYKVYQTLGAQFVSQDGASGVRFAVWAPNAVKVALIGDFNAWKPSASPMRSTGESGVWELFLPGLGEGVRYKFLITTEEGQVLEKSDPYAFRSETRPQNASVTCRRDLFVWTDEDWMAKRGALNAPVNVYEVHLGSWKKGDDEFLDYRQLARELSSYCKEMGYTHIELLPIMEHPLDESWGYQVTGFYSATSRYGSLQDLKWFVNWMHQQGIGVIFDWVPAHFPNDGFGLAHFDGQPLYEHEDPNKGFHPHWNTHIFDYGRPEVSNFLIGSALYWIEELHVDALRVDAVASMLYLDYGRDDGQWIPNEHGGVENLEAIEFLKHLNSIIHQRAPDVWTIAEESTAFPGITRAVHEGGLGFTMKWNMGWMNDSISFFQRIFSDRSGRFLDAVHPYSYAFLERFMLPLSHDEVVHLKKSLLSKMPGKSEVPFANLLLLLTCMLCHPGKKLLFMGGEIGQLGEWDCKGELEWSLLDHAPHRAFQEDVKALNHLYLHSPALWERDFDPETLEWFHPCESKTGVAAYLRKGNEQQLLCVHNFSDRAYRDFTLRASFDSMNEIYSSEETVDTPVAQNGREMRLALPPFSTRIFEVS